MYIIYASNEYPVDTSRPENIVAQEYQRDKLYLRPYPALECQKHFAVTAVDRYGNESTAAQK